MSPTIDARIVATIRGNGIAMNFFSPRFPHDFGIRHTQVGASVAGKGVEAVRFKSIASTRFPEAIDTGPTGGRHED